MSVHPTIAAVAPNTTTSTPAVGAHELQYRKFGMPSVEEMRTFAATVRSAG